MNYIESIEDLESRIYNIIRERTNLPVTIRNASNQKITTQFVELHFVDFDLVGWGERYEVTESNFKQPSAQEWEVSVEIACHRGTNPSMVLQQILHCFQSQSSLYEKYFKTQDSAYLRASSIRRRDYPLDKTQWELRSIMTVVFSMVCVEADTESLDIIETVKLSGVNGGIKVILSEDNVLVDELEVTYP